MTNTDTNDMSYTDAEKLPPHLVRRAVVASIIGNGLEWYDYMLYGFFAVFISQTFFPSDDLFVSTMITYATFAISFFFRPIGGLLLGIYSDRIGRKPALTLMIFMMGIATVAIGLTPSYETIGITAAVIVILARILQGLSVGGEFGGATAMLVEFAPKDRKVLFGSFQTVAQSVATALAAGLGLLAVTILTSEQMSEWGWRILFLLGGIIAPVGFYIRSKVPETPEFTKNKEEGELSKTPIRDLFKKYPRELFAGLGMVAIGGVFNYVWFVYMTMYVVHELNLPLEAIFASDLIAGLVMIVLILLIGSVSDKIGGWRIYLTGIVLFTLSAYPLFAYLLVDPTFERLIIVQVAGAAIMSLAWASMPGIFSALYPSEVRATGMSISYNAGVLMFGAIAPGLLTVLIEKTGDLMMPAYYIALIGTLSLLALLVARDTIRKSINEGW